MNEDIAEVRAVDERQPLLYLDVNLGKGKVSRLVIN
jgi:hypothetical protein